MNKTLIKWIAIIAVTAIAAVIAVVIINNSKNTPVSAPADTEAPIYVSYCTGGRTYTFSDGDKLPDTFSDAFHDVRYCMLEYAGLEQK